MQISLDTVRAIARLLEENDLAEIALETNPPLDGSTEAFRLTLQRAAKPQATRRAPSPKPAMGTAPSAENTPAASTSPTQTVDSNVVGLFRTLPHAVVVGSEVRGGQVLGVVEALKVPNDIKAPKAGRIVEVLIEDGGIVEFGQPLFVMEPAGK
jgi:acetyl-CoA carboxylase biotin carboxyl carrier protein